MAKNIELRKKINNSVEVLYPKTVATNVYMSNGKTVEARIGELQNDLTALTTDWNTHKAKLQFDTVYWPDPDSATSGKTYLDDGNGLNLVAVY